jgi:hypothetical protein
VYCLLGSKAEQCGDTNVDKMTLFQKPNGNDANLKATTAAAQMNDKHSIAKLHNSEVST